MDKVGVIFRGVQKKLFPSEDSEQPWTASTGEDWKWNLRQCECVFSHESIPHVINWQLANYYQTDRLHFNSNLRIRLNAE